MKVTLRLAIVQAALASVSLPESTVVGKLRVSILSADRTTILSTQDVDDAGIDSPVAVFNGIPAGSYVGSAQRVSGDDVPVNIGSSLEVAFDVNEAQPKTFGQPSGFTVTVEADA